jgi:hypothetical protein
MIEIAKLEKMVQAEVAADSWWDGLSDKEKKAYVKAHPNSKYAGSKERAVTPRGQDFHTARATAHGKQKDRHLRKMSFHERMADKTHGRTRALHSRAAKSHEVAYRAHDSAEDAHTNVETPEESTTAMKASHAARKRTAVAANTSADAKSSSIPSSDKRSAANNHKSLKKRLSHI